MDLLQTRTFFGVNCFIFLVYVIQGEPEWIVNEKVSGYGNNLTLFCLIDECCTKEAGWVKFDPDYETIFLDVRNSKNYTSTDKYAAKTNSTGFSLTIKNIQIDDINIGYACVYGFVQSRTKVLNQSEAFRDDETSSELPITEIIAGIIVGVVVLVAVAVSLFVFQCCKHGGKRNSGDSTKNVTYGVVPLMDKDASHIDMNEDAYQHKDTDSTENVTYEVVSQTDEDPSHIDLNEAADHHKDTEKPSKDERNRYMKVLEFGEEVREYVRIQVIGKDRVGKTSLVSRLLGYGNHDGKSTDGIEINRKCQIRKTDGEWIVGKDSTSKINVLTLYELTTT